MQEELKRLEEKNRKLKATVQEMEELAAWLRLRGAFRKRKGEGGDSDQGGKKKRQ